MHDDESVHINDTKVTADAHSSWNASLQILLLMIVKMISIDLLPRLKS
jgi:hypothetical protein